MNSHQKTVVSALLSASFPGVAWSLRAALASECPGCADAQTQINDGAEQAVCPECGAHYISDRALKAMRDRLLRRMPSANDDRFGDAEAHAFEAAMREEGYDTERRADGLYVFPLIRYAWLGWRLAKRGAAQ